MKGSYQFENLESRHREAKFLSERAQLRLDDFPGLLTRHGLATSNDNSKPSQKILEVGCGQGIRTKLLANLYPQHKITAIDRSPELLKSARDNDPENGIDYQVADLYELPFADSSFDFIYVRLVFMHLNKPLEALKSLQRVLRPGGRILIEDADRDCMFFEPQPKSFSHFWTLVQDGQRRLGGDPNIGRKLAPFFKKLSFKNINIEAQPIVGTGSDIAFLVRTLMPSLNLYLKLEDQIAGEAAIKDLEQLAQLPEATFYHFWFAVSAEKQS